MEQYSKYKRNELKTLPSNLLLNNGPGHKSHLNLFHLSKKSPKYLKALSIEEYDIQQNESLNKYREFFEEEKEKNKLETKNNNKNKSNQNLSKENPNNSFDSNKKLFQNPSQSLNVLTNNNNIYNRINIYIIIIC